MDTFKVRHADGREFDTTQAEFDRTFGPAGFVRVEGAAPAGEPEAAPEPAPEPEATTTEAPAPKAKKG